jgi:hypothetical protein
MVFIGIEHCFIKAAIHHWLNDPVPPLKISNKALLGSGNNRFISISKLFANPLVLLFDALDDLWKAEKLDVRKLNVVHESTNTEGRRNTRVLDGETQRLLLVVPK